MLVMNQRQYEEAVEAQEAVITIGAYGIVALTVPTHTCEIVIPSGTSIQGVIVNRCEGANGEAVLSYG